MMDQHVPRYATERPYDPLAGLLESLRLLAETDAQINLARPSEDPLMAPRGICRVNLGDVARKCLRLLDSPRIIDPEHARERFPSVDLGISAWLADPAPKLAPLRLVLASVPGRYEVEARLEHDRHPDTFRASSAVVRSGREMPEAEVHSRLHSAHQRLVLDIRDRERGAVSVPYLGEK